MDYALQYGVRVRSEFEAETAQEPMGNSARSALSWALFSADLCTLHTNAVGLSIFLLVSVRVGDRRICPTGHRVSQAKKLGDRAYQQMIGWQGLIDAALPPLGEETQRGSSIPPHCIKVGYGCG
jgi:hypothetical protein